MKDARGRVIKVGDKVVYSSTGGVSGVSAGEVLAIEKTLVLKVIAHTEYRTSQGKEVRVGNPHWSDFPLVNVMVVESGGKPVDLSKRVRA